MSLYNAIKTYHDLLTDDMALESQGHLDDQMERRGLFFGDRPLCTVLRPRFLMPQQYNYLRRAIRPLLHAFDKISQAAVADLDFRQQFRLSEWEDQLVDIDPGFSSHTPLSRLDAFYLTESGDMHFTEYNAEVPAASAYNDVLTKVFLGLPVMGRFLHRYVVRPLMTRHDVLHVLLHAYKEWGGQGRPSIAILDWREVPTYSEFELFIRFFKGQGIDCRIVDPRDVEYKGDKLVVGDFQIDLIYKRVLITELIERGGLDHPVVNAVRDGKVCMVNPFRCKILYKKTSLAVLSDERNAQLFSKDEAKAIKAHIPWTRTVEERKTTYNDTPVDLIPFILKYQERFVLKPNDDYGGRGIVLGWQTNTGGWERAVEEALKSPHVVQQRVPIPEEPYPSVVDGRLQIYDRMLDTAPFIFYGDYMDGCLTRLSTDPLLNVSAGGGSSVPTFVVEER
ncbi:MAG: hypothetical protein R3293_03380 [Candidatus Promineifilaceae bacterium]|nr:hypothetical protein [Candidatus Promineifilaceae bacterium]